MLIFSFCKGIIRNLACSGTDTNSLRVSATLQPAGFLATLALKVFHHFLANLPINIFLQPNNNTNAHNLRQFQNPAAFIEM